MIEIGDVLVHKCTGLVGIYLGKYRDSECVRGAAITGRIHHYYSNRTSVMEYWKKI